MNVYGKVWNKEDAMRAARRRHCQGGLAPGMKLMAVDGWTRL